MADLPAFARQEYAFAAHVRDRANPPPPDVSPRRLAIYRELLYNNFESSLSACFPVLKSILPAARWRALVDGFFANHRCRTPYYRRLPTEFLHYLDTNAIATDDPPFLRELAHYEWVELALQLADHDIDWRAIDREGDLLAGVPVVSPFAWPLTYTFPVHEIGPGNTPVMAPSERTHVVVYRKPDDEIAFLALNALSARLLALLTSGAAHTGSQALDFVIAGMPHLRADAVRMGGAALLHGLRERGVILGALRLTEVRR